MKQARDAQPAGRMAPFTSAGQRGKKIKSDDLRGPVGQRCTRSVAVADYWIAHGWKQQRPAILQFWEQTFISVSLGQHQDTNRAMPLQQTWQDLFPCLFKREKTTCVTWLMGPHHSTSISIITAHSHFPLKKWPMWLHWPHLDILGHFSLLEIS